MMPLAREDLGLDPPAGDIGYLEHRGQILRQMPADRRPLLGLEKSRARVALGLAFPADGSPTVALTAGTYHAGLEVGSDGGASLFFGEGKAPRIGLAREAGGSMPSLHFYDKEGQPRVRLALREDDSPLLLFFQRDGKVIWKAP